MLRHRARCSGGRLVARSTLPNKGILGNILLLMFTALQYKIIQTVSKASKWNNISVKNLLKEKQSRLGLTCEFLHKFWIDFSHDERSTNISTKSYTDICMSMYESYMRRYLKGLVADGEDSKSAIIWNCEQPFQIGLNIKFNILHWSSILYSAFYTGPQGVLRYKL